MKTSIDINSPWGDSIDTVLHSKPLTEWYSGSFQPLPYNVFMLPKEYSFDIEEMKRNVNSILEKNETIRAIANKEGKTMSRYKGLGFFARKHSNNPLADHFVRRDAKLGEVYAGEYNDRLHSLVEDDFTEETEIMTDYFRQVFSVFNHKITKASLLDLAPKGHLGSHIDFPYYKNIRLHATVFGGEGAWYEVAGEKFQLPADGNWYFMDVGKYHSIWNKGPSTRLTLNVNLTGLLEDPYELAKCLRL